MTAHVDVFLIEILRLFFYRMIPCATKIMLFPLKILLVNLKQENTCVFIKSQTGRAFNAIIAHKCMLCITHRVIILASLVAMLTSVDVPVDVWPAIFMGAYHEMYT